MNVRSIIASCLLSPLFKINNYENTSQFKLVKCHKSKRVIDLLIHKTIRITLWNNLITFFHTGKVFELQGDLLKMITKKR